MTYLEQEVKKNQDREDNGYPFYATALLRKFIGTDGTDLFIFINLHGAGGAFFFFHFYTRELPGHLIV